MLNEFYTNQIKNLSAELLLLKEQYNKLVNLNEEEASAREYNPRTFDTILAPHEEQMFSKFAETAKLKNESVSNHYDLRAFYLDNVTPEVNGTEIAFSIEPKFKRRDGSFILPDTYKKPSHPTFSEESMYHGANNHEGISQLGGRWLQVGKSADNVFIAHPIQIDTPEKESALLSHFREVEPNHVLVHPVSMEVLHHPTFIPSEKDYKQSSDDYARMRIERLKGLPHSTASVLVPVEVDLSKELSPRLQDLMQRMYGTRGGGAVGGGQVIPPVTITGKVAARVSDVMDETGGINQDEIEKIGSSGAFERQSTRGHFPVGRGGGSIKLTLPKNPSIKQVPRYEVTTGGNRIFTTDLSNMITFSSLGGNPIRAGEAEFETIYGLEGADDSIRHKGSSVSFQIKGDATGMQRVMRPGQKQERRDTEELIYQPLLTRRAVRSIEDLQADYEGIVGEINAHLEKHDITDEEIRTVKKKSHEELKKDVRDLFDARRVKATSSRGLGRYEYPSDYTRKRALRDLKSKIILAQRLKSSIENYDPSAQSEPEYDPTERLYDAMRNAGTSPATDPAMLRGNKDIGIEEYPALSNLMATMSGSEGAGINQLNAMREIRRRFYRDREERGNREAEEARQAEESKPEAVAARLKQIEQGLAALKRERDDAFAAAEEKRVAGPREIDTGLSAEEIEKIGPNRKKTSRSTYVRKSERVKLEAEAQESKSRMEKEAQVLAKKQAEQRAEFESMLARDFPDLEPERYSAVTPERVSGRGADLARDLAYRASARRKGVPLAKRPDFIRYLGEAVLNISRARTIS
jgi:hypothetical protein